MSSIEPIARRRKPRGAYGSGGLLTRVALALAAALVLPSPVAAQVATQGDTGSLPKRSQTVAVVPFANISGQASDDWIGAGIAETVMADLQRAGVLAVVRREALLEEARKQAADLPAADDAERLARELGPELGVNWLVSGAYQRLGDRLRITARIFDVATGAVSRAVKLDGGVDEIFALQDRIVVELVDGFEPLGGERPASRVASDAVLPASGRPPSRETMASRGPAAGAFAPRGERPTVSGRGRGNEDGGARPAPSPEAQAVRAPVPDSLVSPGGLAPDDITGVIAIGVTDNEPRFDVAASAGILTGRPAVRPPRAPTPPAIDGRLDDAAWRSAVRITDFVQQNPVEGAPATEATDVYIAYDSQNIYVGISAHYSDPSIMRANRIDRDQAFRDDNVSVYFDTFLDQQRAYVFSVNGYGVQGDSIMSSSGGGGNRGIPRGDSSWDALFDSAGQIVDDGFTAEIAIPFKSLRYPQKRADDPHRWGFQIVREIHGKDENVVWAPISRAISGFLPQMGVLEGMSNLSTSRNVEIMPTFTAIQFGSLNTSTGAYVDKKTDPEGGVNFKYGITSNLTADVTFNPDFSQIESDRPQIEVNQRFALFFPELRPFFLEGAEIFRMPGAITIVHSRTIVDPDYGGKITGKVGNTTVGLMVANDAAPGTTDDPSDPAFGKSANVFVGRVRYDPYAESHVGVIFTNREFLDSHSRLGGVEGDFRLGRTQSAGFKVLRADHRDLDGVVRTGQYYATRWQLNGRNWGASASGFTVPPDFRTDVGFVRRVDQKRVSSRISYRWWPQSWIIDWGPSVNYGRTWNFDDVLEDEDTRFGVNASFAKNIRINFDVRRSMERFGGINFDKTGYSFGGSVMTNRNYSLGGSFRYGDEVRYSSNPFLGRGGGGSLSMTLRPVSRFQSDININTSRLIDPSNNDELVFDVKIVRALSTYQFTDRLLLRNITEYNTFNKTLRVNMLVTYRLNAGTVFFVGYDDRYRQGDRLFGDLDGDDVDDQLFPTLTSLKRTNRAFFTKLQYLFRY